jgi:hypothetical protein
MREAEVTGFVSATLEQEVRAEVRRQGTVVWLDKDASYTAFVDALASRHATGDLAFPVVGFRGSFLDLLLELEPYGNGLDPQPLLIHMPGFTEESIRQTPVLELYEAGVRFRRGLSTLIREAATSRIAPDEVEKFIAKEPSLEEADAWIAGAVSHSTVGLAAALAEFGPRMLAEAMARPDSPLAARVTAPEELTTLRNYLHSLTGMDEAWEAAYPVETEAAALDRLLRCLGGWVLSVEYARDLTRPSQRSLVQRLAALSPPLTRGCLDLVTALRRDHVDAYVRIADEAEAVHAEELKATPSGDLGQVDTFREEEHRVLAGAVEALLEGQWAKAKAWCDARQGESSFWLQRDQQRRLAWNLVGQAAELGETLARHSAPLEGAQSLEDAAVRYAAGPYEVDRAHRRFEQTRSNLLQPWLPHFGELQEVVGGLRRLHREWADRLAADFARLCVEHGFLSPASHQQRTLFDQVVHPLTMTGEKVAVFLVDAFRYEMATELVEELKGPGTVVDLKPRLAELPTITAVGMNVLAPVAQGDRLAVAGVFKGFRTGEFTVNDPATRARAMGTRSAGKPALLLNLTEVCNVATPLLTKQVKPHTLIVVHSKEIDDAGEANVGLATFESTLLQIKAAWHHLQLAGVKSFVFTADHGFLLQCDTPEVRKYGSTRDPQRRHVIDEHPRSEKGMVHVSLSSLGYDGLSGYLLFLDDTAVFATGNPGATFVHGGNSLQERVIPVLTVTRKQREVAGFAEYNVEVEPGADVMGSHRMRLRVVLSSTTTARLGFATARGVDLAIRVLERDAVRTVIKDVTRPGELRTGRLRLPVGEAWTEVFFGLEGPSDERVRVEVYHPDSVEKVTAAKPEAWFTVKGTTRTTAPSTPPPAAPASWADAITDEGMRRVFLHIQKHGAITELEVRGLLVTRSAMRRFTMELDALLEKLPFKVRTETGDEGKRYVREGER